MAYQDENGQEWMTIENHSSEGSIEVEEVEFDPTRRGYTQVPNYFSYYWTPLLGAKTALTYERLCSFAHGTKDNCYPSIGLLADILAVDRHDLTGRTRRDSRPGRQKEYYQPGFLQQLVEAGLLRIETREHNGGRNHYKFIVVKSPPLLSPDQVAQLPQRLQRKHQNLLNSCQKEREDFARMTVLKKPRGGGGGTGGGMTPYRADCDAARDDLTKQRTKKINTTRTSPPAPDHLATQEGVKNFYHHIGQEKVSRQAINAGMRIVANLKSQGYTLVDILWVMSWITSHPQQFGGQVRSINLVPLVIGYVLQQKPQPLMTGVAQSPDHQAPSLDLPTNESTQPSCAHTTPQVPTTNRSALSPEERQRLAAYHRQQERYRQQERDRQADLKRQQERDRLYQALASTEQTTLREAAVSGLLAQGIKPTLLSDMLIRDEVYRLLGEQQKH